MKLTNVEIDMIRRIAKNYNIIVTTELFNRLAGYNLTVQSMREILKNYNIECAKIKKCRNSAQILNMNLKSYPGLVRGTLYKVKYDKKIYRNLEYLEMDYYKIYFRHQDGYIVSFLRNNKITNVYKNK